MKQLFFLLSLSFGLLTSVAGQRKMRWVNKNLSAAMQIADIENKMVFVDTYTNSCAPCKIMDRELLNPDLVTYFNKNFISVKIDMNSDLGKSIKVKYELVFLPTLMILDTEGNLLYKVEEVIPAKELLYKSRLVRDQNINLSDASSNTSIPVSSPNVRKSSSKTSAPLPTDTDVKINEIDLSDIQSEEKILFVLGGNNENVPPFILKEEAYHRLTMGDGSHLKAAKEYLESQDNWTSEENTRFIYDFLSNTKDTLFQYVLNNRAHFESVIGKKEIDLALHIIIHERLQRGFPRPNLEESLTLFRILNKKDPQKLAYRFRLDVLFADEDYENYMQIARVYLSEVQKEDFEILNQIGQVYILGEFQDKALHNKCIDWLKKAIVLAPNRPAYNQTLAHLYYLNGKKSLAHQQLELAREKAVANGKFLSEDQTLEKMINSL